MNDLTPPGAVEALHAKVPDFQRHSIPYAAHSLHWEAPQAVAGEIRSFLG